MCKVILILDKFFLKYKGGVKLTPPPEKTTLKKSSLIRVKSFTRLAYLLLLSHLIDYNKHFFSTAVLLYILLNLEV